MSALSNAYPSDLAEDLLPTSGLCQRKPDSWSLRNRGPIPKKSHMRRRYSYDTCARNGRLMAEFRLVLVPGARPILRQTSSAQGGWPETRVIQLARSVTKWADRGSDETQFRQEGNAARGRNKAPRHMAAHRAIATDLHLEVFGEASRLSSSMAVSAGASIPSPISARWQTNIG